MSNRPGPLAQSIAAEIRAELGRQQKSRRWLAEQIGQSHVTVSRWVNGDGPVSLDSLDAMCHALGLSVADLLTAVESHRMVDVRHGDAADTPGMSSQQTRGFVSAEPEYTFAGNGVAQDPSWAAALPAAGSLAA